MEHASYSVRMRAAKGGPHNKGGRHISGAERIVSGNVLLQTVQNMLRRAQSHSLGEPDFINLSVERIDFAEMRRLPALKILTPNVADHGEALKIAREILGECGVQTEVMEKVLELLKNGPAPGGGNMRGAVIMDAITGERLEPDPYRGVRASKMDYTSEAERDLEDLLSRYNLNHYRVREALALATKVAGAGTIAELCCSDEPNYTTGYVASPGYGYVRLPYLKPGTEYAGGRVFFVRGGTDIQRYVKYLEDVPVIIDRISEIGVL